MIEMAPVTKKPVEDKTTVVFLSFYLLLLAFFILLNSISQQERERTLAAMGSLEATFRSPKPTSVYLESIDTETTVPSAPNRYQIRLLRVFENELPLARYAIQSHGNVLRMEMPIEAVFDKDSAVVKRNMRPILEGVSEVLSDSPPKARREVEIMLGSGPGLHTAGDKPTLDVARTGAVAAALVEAGTPENAVYAGVQPGDPGTVVMTFFSRDLGGAKVDFADGED
jgi:hypothetical protein